MKTADLTGALLDYWVAKAEGKGVIRMGTRFAELEDFNGDVFMDPPACCYVDEKQFRPSANWAHGGPIIDAQDSQILQLEHCSNDPGLSWNVTLEEQGGMYWGSTMLEAAMRAFVASKFGTEVPDEVPA